MWERLQVTSYKDSDDLFHDYAVTSSNKCLAATLPEKHDNKT